jgi:hypothetical protein
VRQPFRGSRPGAGPPGGSQYTGAWRILRENNRTLNLATFPRQYPRAHGSACSDRGVHRAVADGAPQLLTRWTSKKSLRVFNCRGTPRRHALHQSFGVGHHLFSRGGWVGAENGATLLHPIVKPLDVRLTTRFGLFLANLSPAKVSVWPLNSRKGDGRAGGRRW